MIPPRYLCPLPQRVSALRADAALAFYRLNAAYRARFGVPLCVSDAYRSLPQQQRLYARQPGLTAVPGRSNHGYGLAVDLCGGAQNHGSAPFAWLRANAGRYGWFHPAWVDNSPFEPWHWEYRAAIGAQPSRPSR